MTSRSSTLPSSTISLKLLLPLLAAIIAMSPLAIDMYLPAMPVISLALDSNIAVVQNTLSVYLFGYAVGLLIFGPLADKHSRRLLVMLGVGGFTLTTLMLPWCQSIEQFFTLRFFQAMISSAATVVVPGTIREYYGDNSAKGFSYVSMIMMLAPMIAPSIGSALLVMHSWQLIFYVLAIYSFIVFLLSYKYLPEVRRTTNHKKMSAFQRYKIVLANHKARADLLSIMMISLAFFGYITAIPFIYLTVFKTSEFTFSILFAANVLALMTAHFINTRLVVRKGSRTMLISGLVVATIASSGLMLVSYWQLPIQYTVVTLLPLMGSFSMIAVNAEALLMKAFAENAGTATAVIGTLRFGIGALAGPILTAFYDGSAFPFALLLWSSVMLVLLLQCFRQLKY
ncbi:multidrug effflux MFS transporter [Colwelliaceae bacterium 6471]